MWRKWDDLKETIIAIMYFLFVPPILWIYYEFHGLRTERAKSLEWSGGGEVVPK